MKYLGWTVFQTNWNRGNSDRSVVISRENKRDRAKMKPPFLGKEQVKK